MKTIRNSVFETNSSSMHSFCISNDEPSITQFNDLHMKIDASGEYGWGPGIVESPADKLDYAIVAMLEMCTESIDNDVDPSKDLHKRALGHELVKEVGEYLSAIANTFAKHNVIVTWGDNLSEFKTYTYSVMIKHDGYIDHQSGPHEDGDCAKIANWAKKDPESLFNYCFNNSYIELDNDNH